MKIAEVAWFMKYRPTELSEFVFESQEHKTIVEKIIEQGFVDGNMLLYGRPGAGKTSLVAILASKLNGMSDIENSSLTIDYLRETIQPKLLQKPMRAKKRIIILNEFSPNTVSNITLNYLNDRIFENYQNNNTFIATTNHFSTFDESTLRRFNYRLGFNNNYDYDMLFSRILFILRNENKEFQEDGLSKFLKTHLLKKTSLSDIITDVQIKSSTGRFLVDAKSEMDTFGSSDELFDQFVSIFEKISETHDVAQLVQIQYTPQNSIIAGEHKKILEITNSIININFYNFLLKLKDRFGYYLPLAIAIEDAIEKSTGTKMIFMSKFLFDFIERLTSLKTIGIIK
jgi:Cdc6-like AAA superfamily ATPase